MGTAVVRGGGVLLSRRTETISLSCAIEQHGQVVDMLRRDKRDRVSALAFFRRALSRTGTSPHTVVSAHHRVYSKAVATTVPTARHIRTGLHRARGETTKPIDRSHIATRDRLRDLLGG